MPPAPDVTAAGAVVFRPGRQVLLVHRPRYDDWSFPKGKLDRGERAPAAAVREVAEETGLRVRLGVPLADQRYPLSGGRGKVVHYWVGRCLEDDDVDGFDPNDEVDDVRWADLDEAADLLTYERDRDTLREARRVRRPTHAVVVLRHALARSRQSWKGEDRQRPLLEAGRRQAEALVPLLQAYGVRRMVTSSSVRCLETLTPYAESSGLPLETTRWLSEEDATPQALRKVVADLVDDEVGSVVCTHRPVLPGVFDALGLDDPGLAKGEMLVAHVRKGEVRAVERHLPR